MGSCIRRQPGLIDDDQASICSCSVKPAHSALPHWQGSLATGLELDIERLTMTLDVYRALFSLFALFGRCYNLIVCAHGEPRGTLEKLPIQT